ncbi:MAG TPA: chemotaxis protein CheW [Thermomicrobiales bacterium]|nr:chemotaxis protein CheW [Thermomicrobiales bacterium]
MSGTESNDDLALLIASFVEEVQPFLAGIRRGAAGIFALGRDAQAIAAARASLGTIAASAQMFDLPAVRHLAELAQQVDEAFGALERGGVPDEAREPLLAMADNLDAQLDGLLAGDERGRERLDRGYDLLERVLQAVEQADIAPPEMAIDLDALLATLGPAAHSQADTRPPAPPAVAAPAPEPVPAPVPEPEPAPATLHLLPEEEIAPIEWGAKEAIVWEKRGWDESGSTYGNTDWVFLDTDDTGPLAEPMPTAEAAPAPDLAAAEVADEPAVVAAEPEAAPLAAELPVAPDAAETLPLADWPVADIPAGQIAAADLEEAAWLALSGDDAQDFHALDPAAQEAVIAARRDEMAGFAASLGLLLPATAPIAADEPGCAAPAAEFAEAAAAGEPVFAGESGTAEPPAPVEQAADAPAAEEPEAPPDEWDADWLPAADGPWQVVAGDPSPADDLYDALQPVDVLADDEAVAVAAEPAGDGVDEVLGSGPAWTLPLPAPPGDRDTAPTGALATADEPDDRPIESVPVTDALLLEQPLEFAPDLLETGSLDVHEADVLMGARLVAGELQLHDAAGADAPADGLDFADLVAGAEPDDDGTDGPYSSSFLDALLDESDGDEMAATPADEDAPGDDGAPLDPDFGALPDVPPEIEAAFATLNDADMATFLTLDGDAALAFLQERVAAMNGHDAAAPLADTLAVAAEVAPVADDGGWEPLADGAPLAAEPPAEALPDLDPDILDVFLLELHELLETWGTAQARLRRAPADAGALHDLRVAAHTVRGAANMVRFHAMGEIGRQIEELCDLHAERGLIPAPPALAFVAGGHELLRRLSADGGDPRGHQADLDAFAAAHAALLRDLPVAADTSEMPTESWAMEAPPEPRETPALASYTADAADPELVAVFIEEAEDHLAGFNRALVALDHRPYDRAQMGEARRLVHTLKGAANTLGYPVTGRLCHSMEDLFDALDERGAAPSRAMIGLFFASAETLEGLIAGIAAGRDEDAARADALRAQYAAYLQDGPVAVAPAPRALAEPAPEPEAALEAADPAAGAGGRTVRVDIGRLDSLLNAVGELVTNRAGQEQHVERFARTLSELLLSVERLRRVSARLESRYEVAELMRVSQARQPQPLSRYRDDEFDDLELDRYTELHRISRELIEVAADVSAAGNELGLLHDGFDQALNRQRRIANDLQDQLMEVRLVPISTVMPRLYRAARNVALRRGREVDLVLDGEETGIDKVLLEELTDPLLHIVRNAVDHGIEDPAARVARGKPATGTIRISATREGNEAIVRVADDGAGIDVAAVLERARRRGYALRRDDQPLSLIFLPGLSTSETVSDISGRGVGLDVVRTNIGRLKGTIDVASTPGAGTTFTIRLPIMLTVTRALLVRAGAQTFAVPLAVVEEVVQFRREQVQTVGGADLLDLDGASYPLVSLAEALGLTPAGDAEAARALIVRTADQRYALAIDELLGQQEVVIKRLGRRLYTVPGLAGATILGNGAVVLILNVPDLLGERERRVRTAPASAGAAPARLAPAPADERLALVVDDSLSVRRVVARTLERDGWRVLQAKDGLEALDVLAWARPRVLVLDIEMPRMDGYELAERLRNDPDHGALPIVMLTSRAGEKHRRKAFELGVAAYLVKPFDEAELLRTARELADARRAWSVVG